MSLLRADSVKKVVHRRESETHLAKPLKFHNWSTPCLTECFNYCFPSVALVGCCSCLLTVGFCDRLSVLSDLAERHYPALYKSGTGTRRRGHRDACVGTWDLGTQHEGLEDIKYGAQGRVGRGSGDVKYRDAGCE